ncbi:Hemerythrin domain protein [hydrothermal vent metagenome]|uniref:Hemerythrin domain protein n=1 Tax=hydrothermal vent metagenome TaxID=652676 RepID=A0A3B1AJI5_9ZZZZ
MITNVMSAEHHRCDEIFAQAEEAISNGDWDKGIASFRIFNDAMEQHFTMEENVLFPAVEQRTGMTSGPTQVMRMEHTQMRQLFADMNEAAEEKNQEKYLGLSETLLMVMQQHNTKEEQIVYVMADQSLGADAGQVLNQMGM